MKTFKKLFNRRWWWTTLLVILGIAVLVRLGFWQLDRLDQRRDFNTWVATQWRLDPFNVNEQPIPDDLHALEYQRVQAQGEFDYSQQIALKNQNRNGAPGVNLITPLVLDDQRAILVARGWVPVDQGKPDKWAQYDEPSVEPIVGLIQESQTLPNGESGTVPEEAQSEWFRLDIPAIQAQMPYELMPVFILQLPEDGRTTNALPFREEPIRLDEGSHLSYSIQWFMFALVLGFGYIQFIRYQEQREIRIREAEKSQANNSTLEQVSTISS